jgi:ribosomal protein S18 acetylase RimI-like enzyme
VAATREAPEEPEPARIALLAPQTASELQAVRDLFSEYARSLTVDLCFQNFDAERAGLPGEYAPPAGALLLATVDDQPAGCVAMRPLPECDHTNACEMKRLFVRPSFRRYGLGRQLTQHLMDIAAQAGHSCMLLDTLDDMEAARSLYATLGFFEVPPYYFNPIPGAHYLKVVLGAPGAHW